MESLKPKSGKRKYKIVLGIVLFLLLLRLALPYIILHFANKTLATMPGYFGKIRDIDLAIYRGAYKIKDMYLHKRDSITNMETEFFKTDLIDLSIHWSALLDGRIVGELDVESPSLYFTKDKVEPKQVAQDSSDFRKLLDDFMPLRVNRFEIHNGILKYIDKTSNPNVDLEMNNMQVIAENLTNVKGGSVLPASVAFSANMYEGELFLNLKLDPLAEQPTFDMNSEIRNVNLVKFNDFFKAYANFDINKGRFGLYVEAAGKDGKFVGYFKPLIKDLDVVGPEDKNDNLFRKFWEGTVGAVGILFRNQRFDQVATKVPIEGTFEKSKVRVLTAILEVLRNAFIEALRPSIDYEINLNTVDSEKIEKGPLKDLLKKGKDGDNDKKTNKEKPSETEDKTETNTEKKEEKKGLFKKLFKDKKDKGETKEQNEEAE